MSSQKFSEPICYNCIVKEFSAFKHLSREEAENLFLDKVCNIYKKGDIIYYENHRLRGVYCIYKGKLKLYKTGPEGKQQIIRFAKPGDLIAFRSILSGEAACTSAQALENVILCHIPAQVFINIAKNNPSFSMALIKLSCKELDESNKFILNLAQKPVRERLAQALLLMLDYFDIDEEGYINVILTREEIASIVGTATESIIRLLSEFKKDGLIELKGKKIKILEQKKLEKLANQ